VVSAADVGGGAESRKVVASVAAGELMLIYVICTVMSVTTAISCIRTAKLLSYNVEVTVLFQFQVQQC
jgi:hypothetical protein